MSVLTLDRVSARARELDPAPAARHVGRALLTVLAAVLFAVGWSAGRTVTLAIAAVRIAGAAALWCAAAVALGWREARPTQVPTAS